MSEYAGSFDKIFLTRTKEIIEESKTDYEFTLLLNCTLALICLPIEKLNKNNNYEIIDSIGAAIREKQSNLNGKNSEILRCLRNGIAHLNISHLDKNGQLKSFKISGSTNNYQIKNTFVFTYKTLKELALKFVQIYMSFSK